MNKIIVATDSFKGSLSAPQACKIIAEQARIVFPQTEILQLPIADGGEGLVQVILQNLDGQLRTISVQDPLGRPIQAAYALLDNGTAIIEMAAAAGLPLLQKNELDPGKTSTVGVGELILDAIKMGADLIFIGLGGSATVDAGAGAASALGIRFFDEWGGAVTNGGGLRDVVKADLSGLREPNYSGKIIFLTDVNNPLCGPNGAAVVFGPQKGATTEQVVRLDQGMEQLASLVERESGLELRNIPGMGAAGGFALPFVAFVGAEIRSGIDFVLDLLKFDEKLVGTDLVITGEGRTDAQSAMGKAISAVARRSRAAGVRVAVISGALGDGAEKMLELGVSELVQATPIGQPLEEAMAHAAENLAVAAREYFSDLNIVL
jgi:glycerate kinase